MDRVMRILRLMTQQRPLRNLFAVLSDKPRRSDAHSILGAWYFAFEFLSRNGSSFFPIQSSKRFGSNSKLVGTLSKRSRLLYRTLCIIGVIASISSTGSAGSIDATVVIPKYSNRYYVPAGGATVDSLRSRQPINIAVFGGSVSTPIQPQTPRSGNIYLIRSSFGQPVAEFQLQTLLFGQEIAPPSQANLAQAPIIDPPEKAVYLSNERKLFAADPGFLTVTWTTSAGVSIIQKYLVSGTSSGTPVRMYLTRQGGVSTGIPAVNVAQVKIIPHFNASVPSSSLVEVSGLLDAVDHTGLILLEIRNRTSNALLGVEVLELKLPEPDNSITADVGSFLKPKNSFADTSKASVTKGLTDVDPPLAYVHDIPNDSLRKEVLAVAPSRPGANLELVWSRPSKVSGVLWPYELDRYVVKWPDDFAAQSRRVYHTVLAGGARTPAPNVQISSDAAPRVIIHYNDTIKGPDTLVLDQSRLLQSSNEIGRVLVHYDNWPSPGFLGVQFVDVRPYVADSTNNVSIGDLLKPLTPFPDSLPPKAFVSRGLQSAGDFAYQHPLEEGEMRNGVYAIKKTSSDLQIEVFWNRLGLRGVTWPYEMTRYRADWPITSPEKYQLYVRGETANWGPSTAVASDLRATKMPFEEPLGHSVLTGNLFSTIGAGWSLLRYTPSNAVYFQVVRSVLHSDTGFFDLNAKNIPIGKEVLETSHAGTKPGYIFLPSSRPHDWDRYDWEIYDGKPGEPAEFQTGQIIPVNLGKLEVWWANLKHGVQWFSSVKRYQSVWPNTTNEIVIASTLGSGPLNPIDHRNYRYYSQNDPSKVGFNPNDEHAVILDSAGGPVYALRDDLGTASTSEPYVLLKYQGPGSAPWNYTVYKVRAESPQFAFNYPADAGVKLQSPAPLSSFPNNSQTIGVSGPFWKDRKQSFWARAAGDDGGAATIVMRFFYTVRDDFYFPDAQPPTVGSIVPWLDRRPSGKLGVPTDVRFTVRWKDPIPELRVGETLVKPKFGLPDISLQTSVEILYQQPSGTVSGPLVKVVDPTREVAVALDHVPNDVRTVLQSGLYYFPTLPPQLRSRLFYDPAAKLLKFRGKFVEPATGEYWLLPNVITTREQPAILGLSQESSFSAAATKLFQAASKMHEVDPNDPAGFDSLALTAGLARGSGYVTLAFGSSTNTDITPEAEPVGLNVIRVTCPTYRGEIKVIRSDNPLDEKLTLRHSGDFAGKADDYVFEWRTLPPADGNSQSKLPPEQWNLYPMSPATGEGVVDITLGDSGLFSLKDNYFMCRYRPKNAPVCGNAGTNPQGWSEWTAPQLAEGWIKRVVGDINPFNQRAASGGLDDAETRFSQFHNEAVDTVVSMISQAGKRASGDVALTAEGAKKMGLIEIYETVMNRGISLSIDGAPAIDDSGANDALLLVASRISDLYMLLGNEAYADAADPTISFGTDDRTYGEEAASIHCFQNQTASLLEEELTLLRGRDNHLLPRVDTPPFFNRLIWNFTKSEGEVAYVNNYDIKDANDDGVLDAADAALIYPQGHGDAWGHYLTALSPYYRLLRNAHFTWVPRTEAILVGGVPVSVDYYDERRFAAAAAARARTGAEIVNLTYRSRFVEDPQGQQTGYPDSDPERLWGVEDWGTRVGQGDFFDWVVGNALLPDLDRNAAHSGIQKIDRTTVLPLQEIASSAADVQAKIDSVNQGLNPLGLASGVIPFDIDPTAISQGKSHFEQIYDRAVHAMNNAIAVFNHANNASQLLRRQTDTIQDFHKTVEDRENDFTNRLVEVFGLPYLEDVGPGATYPAGYQGPDLLHFQYIDVTELAGVPTPTNQLFSATLTQFDVGPQGELNSKSTVVKFPVNAGAFQLVKPPEWSSRRAIGEAQRSMGEIVQAQLRFEKSLNDYGNLLTQIEEQGELLRAQFRVGQEELQILDASRQTQISLNDQIKNSRTTQQILRTSAQAVNLIASAVAEFLPTSVGVANDVFAPARGAIRLIPAIISQVLNTTADFEAINELGFSQSKEIAQATVNLQITTNRNELTFQQQLTQLRQLIRQEGVMRFDLYSARESLAQLVSNYQSVIAKGLRIQDERARFRAQTAAQVQAYRYKDMAFRVFRNDALQKYRAQFDLAAMYVYLAARAYDYETCFLVGDPRYPGSAFMNSIVRARTLGLITSGEPQTAGSGDPGLSDPLARMKSNWDGNIRGQLGFNNPQIEGNRFSLRYELYRTQTNSNSRAVWREVLAQTVVTNLLAIPEFQRYCLHSFKSPEPGLVISFQTTIQPRMNFFGLDAIGGDNSYSASHFATKIRSVGVWFANYNNQALLNTPRVYLVPVGADQFRSSTSFLGKARWWQVLDQKLPAPFSLSPGAVNNAGPGWIPMFDTLSDTFGGIRRYPDFRAYHDSGNFNPAETTSSTELIGRSVWNSRWLLIIPGSSLLGNPDEGIRRFIFGNSASEGVTDIKIFFQTYAFAGN